MRSVTLGCIALVAPLCTMASAETIGPWEIAAAPVDASLIAGGSFPWNSTNVVNVNLTVATAFSGFSIIDDGYANGEVGTTVQMDFAAGEAMNRPGTDLVVFDSRFSTSSYELYVDYDGYTTALALPDTAFSFTGESRAYFYNDTGPYTADVYAAPVDLSHWGIPEGTSITSVRLVGVSTGIDPLGIGAVAPPDPGTPVCFGDGTGTACPCGNSGAAGAGCATRFPGDPAGILCTSASTLVGTTLSASGSISLADQADPTTRLVLTANDTTTQPGLFFSGINTIAGGSGTVFGDGLRCCGGGVRRLELMNLPSQGAGVNCPATGSTTVDLTNVTPGTVSAGVKLCYQYWYRNPGVRSECGTNFNLSNAISITWAL